nr:RNA-directed DNA polymerase, eukaryota, reverse transcriptase zinc-binding domain protein [Tanacetum cinerariifolium]
MARSNSDHNGWTRVFGKNKHHQTKPIDNPYVKDVEKIATSFFVINFPNSLDAKNLWKEFQPFGRIVDAFIANKRSKQASHDRPTFNTNNLPPKRSYASITHAESRNNLSQQSKLDNIKSIQLNDDDLILVDDYELYEL